MIAKIVSKGLALVAMTIMVCSGCLSEKSELPEGGNIKEGDTLPDLNIEMSDGQELTNQSLEGRISMIVFMTTTCSDC